MFWNWRTVRISVGVALLGLAIIVILPGITGHTSLDGTVNARFVVVTSPIEGTVQAAAPKAGTPLIEGQHLLTIINDRIDRTHLVDLSADLTATRERLQSLISQESRLTKLRDELQSRLGAYQEAVVRNLEQEIAVQRERIGVAQSRQAERKNDLARKQKLRTTGHVSEGEFERVQLEERAAQHEIDGAQGELERLERQRVAAGKGVFVGEARNDVPYSLQRMDEVTILLADIASKRKEQEDRAVKLEMQAKAEASRIERLSSASISADFNSVMWRNNVAAGSNVIVGSELLRILDCRDIFVDIVVDEVNYDDVAPGLQAEVRLYGSPNVYPGRVQSVRGSRADMEDKIMAAEPLRGAGKYARIRVVLDPSEINTDYKNFCQVGRTVQVRFDRRSVPFKRWLQSLWFSIS